jgi:hypothetical protein
LRRLSGELDSVHPVPRNSVDHSPQRGQKQGIPEMDTRFAILLELS